jgi:CelD/BcsL family acetyltransferase involved in cellulose biosynthesis
MTIAYKCPPQIRPEGVVVSAHRGGVEIVDNLAEEWRSLCADAADDQPFYRPEWIRAHLRAFLPGAKVRLIAVRDEGRLRLVLPLVEEKGTIGGIPVRTLRAPVNAHGARFDAVCNSGADGDAAISAAWQFLKQMEVWDVLQFRNAPLGSVAGRLAALAAADGFQTVQVPERPSPYVPVPADPELLNRLPPNSKLRSQLRQARRRLAEHGSLSFRRLETADPEALQRFYRLEASGWKGKEGSAILCHEPTRTFYDEMAESAAHFGYFSLYLLELNHQLVAGHYSFTLRGRCYSPKVAYDETFKQFAPGHVIVAEILQDCAMRGIQEFDISGSNDDWKMKWTSLARELSHHFVFKGKMGSLAHVVRFRLRPAIARQLQRRSKSA